MTDPLRYRLITGKDDAAFCRRISQLLSEGYELYGSPALTFNGTDVIAAQAVVLRQPLIQDADGRPHSRTDETAAG